MLCSICIATYKRPQLLERLLKDILNQRLREVVNLEIIIVDNDCEGSAKNIFEKFSNTKQIKLYYYLQPIKNISLTRNEAVSKAKGKYILFVDDDENIFPSWASNLLNTIEKFDADAVFGRIIPKFCKNTPDYIKKCYIFNRPASKTGTRAMAAMTGNCIIKSSILKKVEGPFDPAYGLTGGEDAKLFAVLYHRGAKFVSCYEAWVSEIIPAERSKVAWLLKRAFRTGNIYTRVEINLEARNKKTLRLKHTIIAISYFAIAIGMALVSCLNKSKALYWSLKASSNLGKLFAAFGYFPMAYK